jgi:hypothetical protein
VSKKHSQKSVHVVPNGGNGWRVHDTSGKTPDQQFRTQGAAIEAGRDIAKDQRTELRIHRQNGQIRDSISYGNDPNPPKDKK